MKKVFMLGLLVALLIFTSSCSNKEKEIQESKARDLLEEGVIFINRVIEMN